MATLANTVFPPIVPTFMPAFVNTEDATVTFSISPLNEEAEIRGVHITCVNQSNNENALKSTSGIIYQKLGEAKNGIYSIKIPVTQLKGNANSFNINQFYKVQIRFDCTTDDIALVPDYEIDSAGFLSYLLNYEAYFSEWSTICLIRPILQPQIYLRDFDTNTTEEIRAYHRGIIHLSGQMIFGEDINSIETETLESYIVQVLDENSDEVLYESPTIFTNNNINPNNINYRIDLQNVPIGNRTEFKFKIIATTKNQYQLIRDDLPFRIGNYIDINGFEPELLVEMDNENGIATLTISNDNTVDSLFGILHIKRASSVDNFLNWETIADIKISGKINDMTIKDNTVGSYIWYRYSVQFENSRGGYSDVTRTKKFLPNFYDAILSRKQKQLSLRYNFQVSNYKTTVNRAKIDTLGGKYPKFAENAILNYKQLNISATLSAEDDFNQLFLNKEKYFGDDFTNYKTYLSQDKIQNNFRNDVESIGGESLKTEITKLKEEQDEYSNGSNEWNAIQDEIDRRENQLFLIQTHPTTTYDDWFWEREFRGEVEKWLNDGEPKLYRSMTEGIIPVMITDVSLTPNMTLGRRIWDFSATLYQIGDGNSLEELEKLGIIDIPKVEIDYSGGDGAGDDDAEENELVGQIFQQSTMGMQGGIVSSVIRPGMLQEYSGVLKNYLPGDFYLKDVKIQFHNQPNVFLETESNGIRTLLFVDDPGNNFLWDDEQRSRMIRGYCFNLITSESVGSIKIFVNEKGYYQIPSNVNVKEIIFPQTTDIITVDYLVEFKVRPIIGTEISNSVVQSAIVGQESGVFQPNVYLGDKIRSKYNYIKPGKFFTQMQFWKGICVDVTPYAVVSIKYRGDERYNSYVVGRTGVLHLQNDYEVIDMRFLGRRMFKREMDRKDFLENWEYVEIEEPYESISMIKNPILNCVYTIGEEKKIYYQYQWYDFKLYNKDNDFWIAVVPVEGMINYTGEILKNYF